MNADDPKPTLGISTATVIDFEAGRDRMLTERLRAAWEEILPGLTADLARALNEPKPPKKKRKK